MPEAVLTAGLQTERLRDAVLGDGLGPKEERLLVSEGPGHLLRGHHRRADNPGFGFLAVQTLYRRGPCQPLVPDFTPVMTNDARHPWTTSAGDGEGDSATETTRQVRAAGSSKWPVTRMVPSGTSCALADAAAGARYASSIATPRETNTNPSPRGLEGAAANPTPGPGSVAAVGGAARNAAGGHHSQAGSTVTGWQDTSVGTTTARKVIVEPPKQESRSSRLRARMAASGVGDPGQAGAEELEGPGVAVSGEAEGGLIAALGAGGWETAGDDGEGTFAAEQPSTTTDRIAIPIHRLELGRIDAPPLRLPTLGMTSGAVRCYTARTPWLRLELRVRSSSPGPCSSPLRALNTWPARQRHS